MQPGRHHDRLARTPLTSRLTPGLLAFVFGLVSWFPGPAGAAERLVFEAGSGEGQHAVFATEVGNSSIRMLATNAREPALSPDGQTVAFVRHSGPFRRDADLVTMPFSGGQQTVLRQVSRTDGWEEVDLRRNR